MTHIEVTVRTACEAFLYLCNFETLATPVTAKLTAVGIAELVV